MFEVADKIAGMAKNEELENRNVTGMLKGMISVRRAAKTHQDFWKARIKRCTFRGRDGRRYSPPEFYVRMFHDKREAWFCLETANAAAAAIKARDIYLSLLGAGWEPTLAKFKPQSKDRDEVCTVGEFLADVLKRSHLKPITVRRYAVKLRKMISDMAKIESGREGRKLMRSKFDYVNGGRKAWLALVDAKPIDLLTSESVSAWRNTYVAKAGTDPVKRKSAERSAASYMRGIRALFTAEVIGSLKVKTPANPFAGVKLRDPGPQRYHSGVSAEWLLAKASEELREAHPQQYLALFLCLWAGLRRKEADLLLWEQVDFGAGTIHVRRTAFFEPKTEESQRVIDLAPEAVAFLQTFQDRCESKFVLVGADPNPGSTYDYYRCDCTWRDLNNWLKAKGVRDKKAIHSLRKESGSLIASNFGIEAARQHLGHRDIRTTSSHYVEKKKRIEVRLPLGISDKSGSFSD